MNLVIGENLPFSPLIWHFKWPRLGGFKLIITYESHCCFLYKTHEELVIEVNNHLSVFPPPLTIQSRNIYRQIVININNEKKKLIYILRNSWINAGFSLYHLHCELETLGFISALKKKEHKPCETRQTQQQHYNKCSVTVASSLHSWKGGNVHELMSVSVSVLYTEWQRYDLTPVMISATRAQNWLIDVACQREIRGLVFKLAGRSLVVINRPTDQVKSSLKLLTRKFRRSS